jgi:hypothetical protein
MLPNARPVTVTDAPPLCGEFKATYDNDGPSNVNAALPVPTIPATVAAMFGSASAAATPERHVTLVPVVHEVVRHGPDDNNTVSVYAAAPKLSPQIIIEEPPLSGEFPKPTLVTGASKVSCMTSVPTTAPTVTAKKSCVRMRVMMVENEHATVVSDCHANDEQMTGSNCILLVRSELPKFRPDTVITLPEVAGILKDKEKEDTAASNVKARICVPTKPPTVANANEKPTMSVNPSITKGAREWRQTADVRDDQLAVGQYMAAIDIEHVDSYEPKFRPEMVKN